MKLKLLLGCCKKIEDKSGEATEFQDFLSVQSKGVLPKEVLFLSVHYGTTN